MYRYTTRFGPPVPQHVRRCLFLLSYHSDLKLPGVVGVSDNSIKTIIFVAHSSNWQRCGRFCGAKLPPERCALGTYLTWCGVAFQATHLDLGLHLGKSCCRRDQSVVLLICFATYDLYSPADHSPTHLFQIQPPTMDVSSAHQTTTQAHDEKSSVPETDARDHGDNEPPVERKLRGVSWLLVILAVLAPTFLYALDNTVMANVRPSIIDTFGRIDMLRASSCRSNPDLGEN